MRVAFLNPQGNFDPKDSHMTEHPDFGGQLIYVKEICIALAELGVQADIITRLIDDPEWPEFSSATEHYPGYEGNPRIVRIRCGGEKFLRKEDLWEHMDEFTDNVLGFYGGELPDFTTGHYGDGGYCCVLLKQKAGLGFTFTGHSLGAQKLDKLGMDLENFDEIDGHFYFHKRIEAERLSMEHACAIITSTAQERLVQYGHPLYAGAVDTGDDEKFSVIPPGVNDDIFHGDTGPEDARISGYLDEVVGPGQRAFVVASSRLDEKKNHIGLVRAYAQSPELRNRADLTVFVRGVDDPYEDITALPDAEQDILKDVLGVIEEAGLKERVFFANLASQEELASAYRYFASRGSVFALTAFHEPFGLAPIEAAACGLAVAATREGGPSEIFEDDTGVLFDPRNPEDMARGILRCLGDASGYAGRAKALVDAKYTWQRTAASYLKVIESCLNMDIERGFKMPVLDATGRIKEYLRNSRT